MGIGVVLVLGTAGAVALPVLRCPSCRLVLRNSGELPVRRVRIEGKWTDSNVACPCCVDRRKVTALNFIVTALSQQRAR